jgi:hypothetical protein
MKKKKSHFLHSFLIVSALWGGEPCVPSKAQGLAWHNVQDPATPTLPPRFTDSSSDRPSATQRLQWQTEPLNNQEHSRPYSNLHWTLVSDDKAISQDQEDLGSTPRKTYTLAEIDALTKQVWPVATDYPLLLRLGPAVPTANQVADQEVELSFYQLAPIAGGGEARGTGNQNYVGRIDVGWNEHLQLSAFYSEADDSLFSAVTINDQSANPSNFWQSYGGAVQWQLLNQKNWKLGFGGSLEGWAVGSGGSLGRGQISAFGSPNIFNNSGQRVFTKNLVGSLSLPLSWQTSPNFQLTFTPGVSFLPSSQGAGQGGAGKFYGTTISVSAGAQWRVAPQLTFFGSGLVPLGPGTNSFNSNLEFQRVPILTGGLNYALNPRIGLEAALTNGFGGTPATAVLALPSENQLMYTARMVWNPNARDTPELPFTSRSRSLTLGGLSVNTALIPPAGNVNLWVNGDSEGNLFGQLAWSASNDFQFIVLDLGAFNRVLPVSALSNTYANNGGFNQRFGGKAVFLQQLRGAPFTASGAITLGRNYDTSSFQGYLYAEGIATWMANNTVALNLNPKLAWSGVSTPVGIGMGANVQLGGSFQLIPEVNLVVTDWDQTNGTFALRWLANRHTAVDLYVSNAAGLYDIGQLLRVDQARVGGKLTLQF